MVELIVENKIEKLLAGKAIVTFLSKRTNNHFTYKIKKHKEYDLFYVSVKTGTEYSYMGTLYIKDNYRKLNCTPKSKVPYDAKSFIAFQWVLDVLHTNSNAPDLEIYHEGCCCKCGRPLTTPESIKLGIGPECAKHLKLI